MSMENNDPNSLPSISYSSDAELNVEEVELILQSLKVQDDDLTKSKANVSNINKESAALTPIQRNKVSGLYSVTTSAWKVDLRVDVDGKRPMRMVSGDYYNINGGTTTYFGSFRINSVSLHVTSNLITIEGNASTTWNTLYKKVKITIPRTSIVQPRSPATIRWFNNEGQSGAVNVCQFVSMYFRHIIHEMDFEEGITSFNSYDTGLLPSGGQARILSITKAYNEAGIDFPQITGNIIKSSEAGFDHIWTDVELHASMVSHFSLYKNLPQWAVWSLACKSLHEEGPGLLGIMFDQEGKQRQGCSVFYGGVGGNSSDKLRLQLYTHVHELGHCFNLLHSWEKRFAEPPAPNRPSSLSWMNYPWNYPNGGPEIFWNLFPFQFDDLEIIHLRHAFRNHIVMGGNPFVKGSALDSEMKDIHLFDDPIKDDSGLELTLKSEKQVFKKGEPVVVEIKLSATIKNEKLVHTELHPKMGYVDIGIGKPNGVFVKYENLIDHLKIPETTILNEDNPAVYDSAYIGYGKDLYFDQTGEYLIRAIYHAVDGSQVFSNVLSIKVNSPLSKTDEEIANLIMGQEEGKAFYLLGTSPALQNADQVFNTILKTYPDHDLAVYVEFIKGVTEGREFKIIEKNEVKVVKEPEPTKSIALLNQVVEKTKEGQGLDNISANYAMRKLSQQHLLKKDMKSAKKVMDDMIQFFSSMDLKSNVINNVKLQAKDTLQSKNVK